jgi:hypothetical protein
MRAASLCKLLLVLLAAVSLCLGQKSPASDSPKYDPAKETKITGVIDEVKEFTGAKGEIGVALMVKAGSELVEVRLCPNSFLKEFEVTFNKGDKVEITGAKVKSEDKELLLAREIVMGNNTIVLRDKQGAPVWTWLKT